MHMKLSRLALAFAFMSFFVLSTVSYPASAQDITELDIMSMYEVFRGLQNAKGLTYKLGSRGNGAREFQKSLNALGYSAGDGSYSSKTAESVMGFQAANNLPVTGEADLTTQFFVVARNSPFTRKRNAYIAQTKNYAVIIWPGKAFYVGALDKYGSLLEGTYYYFSGGCYAGEYKDNKRSGKGTAYFVNGDVYVGEWKDDAMHGYGTYNFRGNPGPGQYFSSNEYYKGYMASNKMHGKGIYHSNGKEISGRWANNQRVR